MRRWAANLWTTMNPWKKSISPIARNSSYPTPKPDMKESDVTRLRERLERIGDCVVVVSDMSIVKVHVHTNDPGRALQMGAGTGRAGFHQNR